MTKLEQIRDAMLESLLAQLRRECTYIGLRDGSLVHVAGDFRLEKLARSIVNNEVQAIADIVEGEEA